MKERQGIKFFAHEEIAFRYDWIEKEKLLAYAEKYGKSPYGMHFKAVAYGKIIG